MRADALVALAATLVLAACAAPSPQHAAPIAGWRHAPDAVLAACAELFVRFDDIVDAAGVRDAANARVTGHPHLRADRFLAALAARPDRDVPALLAAMRALDRDARAFELANLPVETRARLDPATLAERLATCGDRLLAATDATALDGVRVPDDYDTWKRAAGLYPIVRIPFAAGVRRYQRETAAIFATPVDALPVAGALVRYGVADDVTALPAPATLAPWHDSDPAALGPWFARHAPVFEIDTVNDADLPGTPVLAADGGVEVDVTQPRVFTRLVHTLFEGRVLPQLVYSVWFAARPKTGAFDLLGGRLDGITWRVTLDPDGRVLLYDAMHNCGCYHVFFPTPRVRAKPAPGGLDERAFVPATLPEGIDDRRVVLRIAAGTHQLQRVTPTAGATFDMPLALAPDDMLRSLSDPRGGRRSLFGPDGIVPGTMRGERWLFWPMGVREPGAMRQWGRHATAFVGRRHFDDAHLLDGDFESTR